MQYHVRTILTTIWVDRDTGKQIENTRFKYQPAFDKFDAEDMAAKLNLCCHHHTDGYTKYRRNYDVCISIWNGKENIYLPLETVEQIASEYTRPALAAE